MYAIELNFSGSGHLIKIRKASVMPFQTLTNQPVALRDSRFEGFVGPFGKIARERGTNLIIFINRRSVGGWRKVKKNVEKREKKVAASEVKVGAGRRDWEREVRPWKVTVVAASSIQVMGSSAAKHGRKREDRGRARREENKCRTKEKEWERANCLLIRPDNCRWVWAHLVSNHLDLTLPRTLLIVLFVAPSFTVLNFYLTLRSLLLFMRCDLRIIMHKYITID